VTATAATARPRRRTLRLARGAVTLRVHARSVAVGWALLLAILVVAVLAIGTGDFPLSPGEVLGTLVGGGPPGADVIVTELRLPRVLDALLCGAALGIAGGVFQSLTRNPLGSPDVIGFTQGAAVGAVLQIALLDGGMAATALGAIVGGLGVALAVLLLARRSGGTQGYRIVLIGIGFSTLLASTTSFLLTQVTLETSQSARLWLVGSLNGRGWEHVVPVALALALLVPAVLAGGRALRMLEMGDDAALALGVRADRSRLLLVLGGVGLAAVATASIGPVAFVALAAPQLARRLTGADGPGLLPAALMGALLLAASDLAAQRLWPDTPLPVGVMTGALGGVYLMWLLSQEWRRRA